MLRSLVIGAATAVAATIPGAAAQPRSAAWILSVEELVVTHHVASDFWSAPDMVVQARRWDADIMDRVHALGIVLFDWGEEVRAVRAERDALAEKKRASEIEPVPPLSPEQETRLESLLAGAAESCATLRQRDCSRCSPDDSSARCESCRRCSELEKLRRQKAASEVAPGEPLTAVESARLEELITRAAELGGAISRASEEREQRLATVTGRTGTVTTDRLAAYFGPKGLLVVRAGDIVEMTVLESDVTEDDLYGRTVFELDQEMLDAGILDLRMPNVRRLRLRFRPEPRSRP